MDKPENKQDVNTSVETKETSKEEPETFTEEQVKERERKASSDVSAELGRAKKLNEGLIKSSQAIQERLAQRDKDEEERELEKHKDEPAEIRRIRAEQRERVTKSELDKTKLELDEEKSKTAEATKEADKHTKERNAREVATRLGVDWKPLSNSTDGSVEAMEELAKHLKPKGDAKTIKPDSGKTSGSGSIPTNIDKFREWVANIPQEEYEKLAPEVNKMMKEGKIK